MDVRNRMADVVKLRCNACQDFLKLIIADDWQKKLYDRAQSEIQHNTRQKDKFIAAYEKMRDIGVENYTIDDMDVTFISAIIHFCSDIAPTDIRTRKRLERLTEDRNVTDHSNENEEAEELYLRGLLDLCNLKDFVRAVDKYEIKIPDEDRLFYRSSYSKKIEELKDILDDERISIVQERKKIEKDLQRLIDCEDDDKRLSIWCDLTKMYMERYWKFEKNPDKYIDFILAASDAGIKEAHDGAMDALLLIKRDYSQVESKLYLLYEQYDVLPKHVARSIINVINECNIRGNEVTEGMKQLIKLISSQGHAIETTEEGLYILKEK